MPRVTKDLSSLLLLEMASPVRKFLHSQTSTYTDGVGFVVVWIAYAFYAIPLIASLAKINVHASEGKDI